MNRIKSLTALAMSYLVVLSLLTMGTVLCGAVFFGELGPLSLIFSGVLILIGCAGVYNLTSWQTRIPTKKVLCNDGGVTIDGVQVRYSEISDVKFKTSITTKRYNFMPAGKDFQVSAEITLKNGKVFRLRAGQAPGTWYGPTLGAQDSKDLVLKLQQIMRLSEPSLNSGTEHDF